MTLLYKIFSHTQIRKITSCLFQQCFSVANGKTLLKNLKAPVIVNNTYDEYYMFT
jgi:hypothetical protein